MSEVDLNIFGLDKAGLIDFYGDLKRTDRSQWFPTKDDLRTQIRWLNREEDNANFKFKYIRCTADYGSAFQTETASFALRLTAGEDRRAFFIKFPNKVHIKDVNGDKEVNTECLILAQAGGASTTSTDGTINLESFPSGNSLLDNLLYSNNAPVYNEYIASIRDSLKTQGIDSNNVTTISDWVYWKMSGDGTGGVLHRNWTAEQQADITEKMASICQGITYRVTNTLSVQTDFPYWEAQHSTLFNGYGMLRYETDMIMTYDELPFPVFDYTQVDDIVKYVNTGDSSGALDVFDSNNPEKEVITDYKTNYRIFVSQSENDKDKTHMSIIAYNNDLITNYDSLNEDYSLMLWESKSGTLLNKIGKTPMEQYPTIGIEFPPKSALYRVYALEMQFANKDETTGSNKFRVSFAYKESSAVGVSVQTVYYIDSDGIQTQCEKVNILDGYRFTASTGEYVEVLFRKADIDDLDGGYSPKEDHEDDKSGTDSDFSGASGLRTFNITNSDFETINKKLWSTDWTTVFKSSSIDPVKCVISCKGIPFTADSVSSAEVVIANMATGLNKNYVKSVKSFNVGSVLMPHYNNDFTDITLTHIRCYLPYIGWVELPASECISRVAYSKVGIEARPKRLKFKYLVDFVDGSVRCVVSVNDTERWFFDGNCSVDIPVTSDNHTQAVSNALRSGLQTGLSIATAVAGAYTSNAGAVAGGVIGAMQNAPNIFPTYSYTATANGSGYINASMNTHIMIVIERPNTIKSTDYAKRVGVPCGLSLNLGSLHGFTVCKEVDVTGIDATPDELAMIKSLLESGVYL